MWKQLQNKGNFRSCSKLYSWRILWVNTKEGIEEEEDGGGGVEGDGISIAHQMNIHFENCTK